MAQSQSGNWDKRADGSTKGNGFLGVLQRPDGNVSSELSMGTTDVNGKETEIPLLVPTLSPQEIQYLLQVSLGDSAHPTMQSIRAKAVDFAKQRLSSGQPVFAQPGEEQTTLYPQFRRVSVQQPNGDIELPRQGGIDPRLQQLLLNRLSQGQR